MMKAIYTPSNTKAKPNMIKIFSLITIIGISIGFAKQNPKIQVDTLGMEIDRLTREKAQLLEVLEKSEAARWQARYDYSRTVEEKEEQLRKFEGKYASEAAILSQKQDQLIRSTNTTDEKKTVLEDIKGIEENFGIQITQTIDQTAEKLALDFPVDMSVRTAELSKLSSNFGSSKQKDGALQGLLQYQKDRLMYSYTQKIEQKSSLFKNEELQVTSLRLGTVWMGEYAPTENRSQLLLRTGRTDGNVFAWRDNLAGDFSNKVSEAINSVKLNKPSIWLPLDVLQNKSLSSGFVDNERVTFVQKFWVMFRQGGMVMYPLALVALLGLILCIDRYIVIWRRSINPKKLKARLKPAIDSKNWENAMVISQKSKSSIGTVYAAIFSQANGTRKNGEKAVRESMMKEIPNLEKRMIILTALGGAAPLMGLLGTVSGMIALFKVITDVGTNDPRILAGGISEALIATASGLVIAIPILLIQGYLNDLLDRTQNDISTESVELLNTIWPDSKTAA